MTTKDPMFADYYSTDLSIPIVRIEAKDAEQAEAIMQKFIDKIALIMQNKIHWDESDWVIQENVYDETTGEWVVS
jgi:hypothetical protein